MRAGVVAVLALLVLGLAVGVAQCSSSADDDLIVGLPGQPAAGYEPFRQYAGFVQVAPTRHLFYWFVESQRDPARDPLVLWLNGGPGCSSLGGLLSENGPWRATAGGSLLYNPYSWNRIANVLYLEEPAGVGFSNYSSPSDRITGDAQTADDAHQFLLGWMGRFSAFQGREFYITGESYAGHYVPDLSERIVRGNQNSSEIHINFKGFMIGNACFSGPIDSYHTINAWVDHGLISDSVFQSLKKECKDMDSEANPSPACAAVQKTAEKQIGDINHYNIYEDVCFQSEENQASRLMDTMAQAGFWTHDVMRRQTAAALERQRKARLSAEVEPAPPCIDTYTHNYLNRADVQTAIHADRLAGRGIDWVQCQHGAIDYTLIKDHRRSMFSVYDFLQQADPSLRILVYSGDIDTVVSTESTRASLSHMNLTVVDEWAPWEVDGQVGGRRVVYDRLSFSTIRYAGHMVPGSQPVRAFTLFQDYLENRDPVDHHSPWWASHPTLLRANDQQD